MATPGMDLKKMATEWFRKGNEAIPKGNWDYAVACYTECVKLVPDNLMFRQTLRATEHKKYNGNGKGATLAMMKLMPVRGRISKARKAQDWLAMSLAAEEGLAINPWDASLHADLGEACRELGFGEVAAFAYEEAVKVNSKSKEYNRCLAEVLEERGEYTRARACWKRILEADPEDGDARAKLRAMDTQEVIDRGGYGESKSSHEAKLANTQRPLPAVNAKGPQEMAAPGESEEMDLKHAIRKNPESTTNYCKLADYYKRHNKLEEAEMQLAKALEVSGGDVGIRELLEDVQLDMLRQNANFARERFTQNPEDAEAKQQSAEMARELVLREIEVLSSRSERYPADTRIKFELGTRYMRIKKWQQAIPLLQQARSDNRHKLEAAVALGKCFSYDGKLSLARRQFESVVKEIKFDDHPDSYKEAYYSLGRICEELKDVVAAEAAYQEVIAVDYGYRDALSRMEALQGGSQAAE